MRKHTFRGERLPCSKGRVRCVEGSTFLQQQRQQRCSLQHCSCMLRLWFVHLAGLLRSVLTATTTTLPITVLLMATTVRSGFPTAASSEPVRGSLALCTSPVMSTTVLIPGQAIKALSLHVGRHRLIRITFTALTATNCAMVRATFDRRSVSDVSWPTREQGLLRSSIPDNVPSSDQVLFH
jgi:hypothetical protein